VSRYHKILIREIYEYKVDSLLDITTQYPYIHMYLLFPVVPPLIHVRREHVGVVLGNSGTLECEVEFFPKGATSWQTADGNPITSSNMKFKPYTLDEGTYKVILLTLLDSCVSVLYYCLFCSNSSLASISYSSVCITI
jgi:hypothetical protein